MAVVFIVNSSSRQKIRPGFNIGDFILPKKVAVVEAAAGQLSGRAPPRGFGLRLGLGGWLNGRLTV
jgi:hypothetical protein